MREKEQQLKEVFSRFDNDLFDKAIREICRVEDFFPKQSVIFRYLERVSPESGQMQSFDYCPKCSGRGRVSLILGIKKHKGPDGVYTKRKSIVHREVWTIERQNDFINLPGNETLANDPDVYISDLSAFCRCKKGRSMYQSNGGGLKLSEMEYERL